MENKDKKEKDKKMDQTLDEKILEEIRQYIDKEYSVLFGITAKDVKSPAIDFRYELGLDSQDMMLMLADFEKKYQLDIPDDKAVTIRTVGDLIDLIKRMSSLDWIRNGQVQPAAKSNMVLFLAMSKLRRQR